MRPGATRSAVSSIHRNEGFSTDEDASKSSPSFARERSIKLAPPSSSPTLPAPFVWTSGCSTSGVDGCADGFGSGVKPLIGEMDARYWLYERLPEMEPLHGKRPTVLSAWPLAPPPLCALNGPLPGARVEAPIDVRGARKGGEVGGPLLAADGEPIDMDTAPVVGANAVCGLFSSPIMSFAVLPSSPHIGKGTPVSIETRIV